MIITKTEIQDVLIIEPTVHRDERGHFLESFHTQRYAENELNVNFVQDNISHSTKSVLRGLHYQLNNPQGKLVWVTKGKVFDVAVDIRQGSPTFGKHVSIILDDISHRQFYIPPQVLRTVSVYYLSLQILSINARNIMTLTLIAVLLGTILN